MPFSELKYAARSLQRNPGLVAIAVLSLGLGIGVNTALYSVFQTVFLEPPTSSDPDRLVRIEPGNGNRISYPNYRDLSGGRALTDLAAYAMTTVNWRAGKEVNAIPSLIVSPNFYRTLDLKVAQGRLPSPSDESAVVITYEFWNVRLNRAGTALGSKINLNGQDFAITGILPPGHRSIAGALGPSLYAFASRAISPQVDLRNQPHFVLFGRLEPGTTRDQVASVITSQGKALEALYPTDDEGFGQPAVVFPLSGLASWQERRMPISAIVGLASIPFTIFGLVLVIACANVAGLLLARGAKRSREIAIRMSLGAPRLSLVRMLLAESLLLALLGAGCGLLLNIWICSFIEKIPLPQAPGPLTVVPDFHALLYAIILALATTLLCGLTPALASTNPRIQDRLRRDSSFPTRISMRRILVAGQLAVSVVLLFLSTLCLRSLYFITTVDPGFDIDHLITARIDLPREFTTEQRLATARQAVTALDGLPGIHYIAISNIVPLGGDAYAAYFSVNGSPRSSVETFLQNVGAGYFRTAGMAVLQGREFTEADRASAPGVAIVNDEFVRAHGLGDSAIGSRVRGSEKDPWLQIVGVVADSKYAFFGERPKSILYRPYAQGGGNLFVMARTFGPAASGISTVKLAMAGLSLTTPVQPQTMRDATSLEFQLRRIGGALLGTVGALGILLSMIGLYGIMAYVVNCRTVEIGIRMVLGATRSGVLWTVLRDSFSLIATGLGIGMAISLAAIRPLQFLMSGINVADPLTMVAVAILLVLAGLGATYVPANRATTIEPAVALRSE